MNYICHGFKHLNLRCTGLEAFEQEEVKRLSTVSIA